MVMTFIGMYRNVDNADKRFEIMRRPEFQGTVRAMEQDELRKEGAKEILAMGEIEIYNQVKTAYGIK